MYPLCISRIDKSSDNIQFDRNTGVVVCMEGVESGGMALVVTETQNQYALYVPEFEVDNLIYNSKSIDMKVKQMCKDKKTLVSVMEKYVVTHGFNCRAKLLDKKSIQGIELEALQTWYQSLRFNSVLGSLKADAFLDKFFPLEMREAKIEEFMNLRQGSMTMKEHCLKNQLSKYASDHMADLRSSMSKFVIGVSGLVVKDCRTAMLNRDMDLSRLMMHAQQIKAEKAKKRERVNKRARIGSFSFSQSGSQGGNCSQHSQKFLVLAPSSASAPVLKFRNNSHDGAPGSKTQDNVRSDRTYSLCEECGRNHLGACREDNRYDLDVVRQDTVSKFSLSVFSAQSVSFEDECSQGGDNGHSSDSLDYNSVFTRAIILASFQMGLQNTTNQQLWWTYEVPIIPMPDKKDYDVPNSVDEEEVSSPIYKRLSERSKKERKKKSSETLSSSTNCCGHEGHNRHSCYFFPKEN
ncbi:putative hyoscyamine 6-dioxygenase-like [Capsicum annuum]|nr:putative hyoscyamine 6-dioxygenase-like [Capsicum annuum]